MSLMDALNTRASGAAPEAHVYAEKQEDLNVGAAGVPVEKFDRPDPSKDTEEILTGDVFSVQWPGPAIPTPEYSDDALIAALKRMQKGTDFMLANLYTAAGRDNLSLFVDLARDVHTLATLRMAKVLIDAKAATVPDAD